MTGVVHIVAHRVGYQSDYLVNAKKDTKDRLTNETGRHISITGVLL